MNQRNSTIELSSSFQPEIRQGRVAGKKYLHEDLKHTVIKHLAKKIKKYSHFQIITTNNSKHVSDFISNNTVSFMELLPNNTTPFPRHQTILTFSESYWETILHIFPEFISSNSDIFREFLPN